jgi:hypothetical protein
MLSDITRLNDDFHTSTLLLICLASCSDDFSHRYLKINETAVAIYHCRFVNFHMITSGN